MQTETKELKIGGMICRSCVSEVEDLLLHTRGVTDAKVSYRKASAQIEYDPALVQPEALEKRLSDSGYVPGGRGRGVLALDAVCLLLTGLLVWLLMDSGAHSSPELSAQASFGAVFLVGLLSSPHCLGMCGGILLGASTQHPSSVKASLAYNGGRILAYTGIGAIFGALGTAISYSLSVKSMVFTMVGLTVTLIGANQWGFLPGLRALLPEQGTFCRLPAAARRRYAGRPLVIGLLTGLMPCGSLYAMWLHAVSQGSAAGGAVSMLAFALGTAPLMLLFGAMGSLLPRRWNKYFLKASAILITAMGLRMLIMGLKMLH